jgi:hypothetical protein
MTYDETIDSLVFRPGRHEGRCVVHRRALRALLGREPAPAESLAYLEEHLGAFEAAARAKIERLGLAGEAHFHLTSRDLRRSMRPAGPAAG